MRSTGRDLDESVLATVQQREAASQVALAMGEIRSAAEQLSAEQDHNVRTTQRVELASRELRELLTQYGVSVTEASKSNGTADSGATRGYA